MGELTGGGVGSSFARRGDCVTRSRGERPVPEQRKALMTNSRSRRLACALPLVAAYLALVPFIEAATEVVLCPGSSDVQPFPGGTNTGIRCSPPSEADFQLAIARDTIVAMSGVACAPCVGSGCNKIYFNNVPQPCPSFVVNLGPDPNPGPGQVCGGGDRYMRVGNCTGPGIYAWAECTVCAMPL